MLEIRPSCENCNKLLPYNSKEAMICSFECTFCSACVDKLLQNVCPNCGGGFEKRPVRPESKLLKYPASSTVHYQPVNFARFEIFKKKLKDISADER